MYLEEFSSVASDGTRKARDRWKDIESGKDDQKLKGERELINIHDVY